MPQWAGVLKWEYAPPPVLQGRALQKGHGTGTLHVLGRLNAGELQKGRCEVDIEHKIITAGSRLYRFGVAHNEGHAEGFLVHESLIVPTVLAKEESLI